MIHQTKFTALSSAARWRSALATLNDGERDLLRLAYFSDLSQSEIAERTSMPLGTVKSRMRTGLIRLRDALQGSVE